jgi:hypothetical protein
MGKSTDNLLGCFQRDTATVIEYRESKGSGFARYVATGELFYFNQSTYREAVVLEDGSLGKSKHGKLGDRRLRVGDVIVADTVSLTRGLTACAWCFYQDLVVLAEKANERREATGAGARE